MEAHRPETNMWGGGMTSAKKKPCKTKPKSARPICRKDNHRAWRARQGKEKEPNEEEETETGGHDSNLSAPRRVRDVYRQTKRVWVKSYSCT